MTTLQDGTIIKNTWALLAFAKTKGKMTTADFHNNNTGESFRACKFTNPENGNIVLVSFGRNLIKDNGNKPLTPQQIAAQKENLQVCEWKKTDGTEGFTLYKPGQVGENELEVDLGL